MIPEAPVVVFDFDSYYLGGAIAEQLAKSVGDVTYVTPAGNASAWTFMTNELPLVHRALVKARVPIHTLQRVNRQDWAVCEGVQSGIRSRVHTRGYYAPMEDWNLDIRRYVTERIGDFVDEQRL